jgi:hypothetical protein
MDEIEAFRVLIRRLAGETPHDQVIASSRKLKAAVERVVKPLGLGKRLMFAHCIDKECPPCEWMIVKVQSSGQHALFEDWVLQTEQDLEARRETAAALELARAALNSLRRLSEIARLTPVQFHQILQDPDDDQILGIQLGVEPHPPEIFVLRDPAGGDAVADFVTVPRRVTLPEFRQIRYLPEQVGRKSASVHLLRDDGTLCKSTVDLYWGTVNEARKISYALHRHSWNGRALSAQVRDTMNAKGKIVRLEWVTGDY